MDRDFGPLSKLPPFQEHPFYLEGMAQIAAGQWQQAFKLLQLLQGIYPDNAEVKELLSNVQMRAALVAGQPRHSSRVEKRRLNRRRFIMSASIAMITAIAGYAVYEVWINPVVVQELRLRQITYLRNEADEAMAAGDYERARQSLQQLEAVLPGDPQTVEALRRIERVEKLSDLYDEAKALMAAGSWDQAIEVLTELERLDAHYRDLPQLLQVAQESQALDRQFQVAEEAFARGDWSTAIAQYEALHRANLTFRFDDVQARLFASHLKYGQILVEEAGTDPKQVTEALSHFSEALKLRPFDAEALNARRLAETYLAALSSADRDERINLLQTIYGERPDYAGKKAAQLLYTALLERADSFLKAGDKASAIADCRIAAGLLVDDPSAAQQMLAKLGSETTAQ